MSRLIRVFAASLLGIAAVAAVPAAPASAAACPAGGGVTVVVNSSVRCDADGGGKAAASSFTGVGHSLTYVTTEPGFVCQIDSSPSSDCSRTPPSSAYWALWWSDGTSGSWVYSTRGATSLKVPAGGFVAFVFGNGKSAPGVSPVAASAPAPKPSTPATKKPSTPRATKPTAKATVRPTSPSATAAKPSAGEPTPTPTATPTEGESAATPEPTEPAATPTDAGASSAAPDEVVERASDESSGSGGPAGTLWAGLAVAVALLAGMGGILWRRRAEGGHDS